VSTLTDIFGGLLLFTEKFLMRCGIYSITNKITGNVYVGSSKNIEQRFRNHKSALNRGVHANSYLLRAWNKYGADNFIFAVVEECDESERFRIEQKYLDIAKKNRKKYYNLLFDASGSSGNFIEIDNAEITQYWLENGTEKTKAYCLEKFGASSRTVHRRIAQIKKLTNKRPLSPKKIILTKKQIEDIVCYWNKYGIVKTKKYSKEKYNIGLSTLYKYIYQETNLVAS
jgi:group I intron endonuclease